MKKRWKYVFGFMIVISMLFLSVSAISAHSDGDSPGKLSKKDEILLKKSTARYHSLKQAEKAGYLNTGFCVASPDGGMGIHFVNLGLVDGEVNPAEPEALLYEPTDDGLKLVGVEYLSVDDNQLFGQEFDPPHGPVPEYSLHVWGWKDNPAGTFTPFNPRVSCPAVES